MYEITNVRVVKGAHSSIQWDSESEGPFKFTIHMVQDGDTGKQYQFRAEDKHPLKKLKMASLRKRNVVDGQYEIAICCIVGDGVDGPVERLTFSVKNGDLVDPTEADQTKEKVTEPVETEVTTPVPEVRVETVTNLEIKNLQIVSEETHPGKDGKAIRWDPIPSCNYRIRLSLLLPNQNVVIMPTTEKEENGIEFTNLRDQNYKISVAAVTADKQGPWSTLVFHVVNGHLNLGWQPRGEELQSPPAQPESEKLLEEKIQAARHEAEKKAVELTESKRKLEETLQQTLARTLDAEKKHQEHEEELRKEAREAAVAAQKAAAELEDQKRKATEDLKDQQEKARQNQLELAAKIEELNKQLEEQKLRKEKTLSPYPQQPTVATTAGTTPQTPATPVTPVTGTTGQTGTPATGNTPPVRQTRSWPWERIGAALGALALILVVISIANKWLLKPQASVPNQELADLKNQLIENQVVLKKLLETSNSVAGAKSPVTLPSPADIQVGGEKISVRPSDPTTWSNKGGKVSHSGNTTTAHTIIGVVNNGEIKNSTIRVMSSEVWTSEWTPTLPIVTCGKEVNAGTNEFVIGPREVQCIIVPIGWLVQPCLEDMVSIDMMCGDDALARTYLPGTKGQTPLKSNQMRFRLKSHVSQETTVRFRVIAP